MTPAPTLPRTSFRIRLTRSLLLLSLAVLTLASLAIYLGVRQALLTNLDSSLLALAQTEAGSVEDTPGEPVHVHADPPALSPSSDTGYEKYAQIKDENGRIRARTANITNARPLETDAPSEAQALAGTLSYGDVRVGLTDLRAVYFPLTTSSGEPMVMVLAIPLHPLRHALNVLLATLGATLVTTAAAAGWGARRIARHLTAPLEHIARSASQISEAQLHARIPPMAVEAELHAVETALNQMLSRLEQAFQAQQELVASQARLMEAQRRFIADASHELRSPLTNLRGTVEVALRRERSTPEYQEVLNTSLEEVVRLSRLVEELLMLTRADSGRLALALEPCDLRTVAGQSVRLHAARAEERGVHVELEPGDACPVMADADRLREVLDNLIDNALRYAPSGSTVEVGLSVDAGQVRSWVKDQGPGLTPEEKSHVFDRFFRADAARSRHSGGLGLGLSIARAIMEAHGGTLTVESQPGEGATFELRMPARGQNIGNP